MLKFIINKDEVEFIYSSSATPSRESLSDPNQHTTSTSTFHLGESFG
jgi:hypothetical protein